MASKISLSGQAVRPPRVATCSDGPELSLPLLDSDIERIVRHSAVRIAERRLKKVIEKITHLRPAIKRGGSKRQFNLLVAYEDALGALRQALIDATHQWVLQKLTKICGAAGLQTRSRSGRTTR
jgi:hypothetical protein